MKTRRWDFVSAHAESFGVQRICRVLQVSRSGYYRWIAGARARLERQVADDNLVAEIREVHTTHKGTYGVRRVHAELRGFGHTVNRKRVERLMRLNRIEGRHLRRRKRTTVPGRLAPPRLNRRNEGLGRSVRSSPSACLGYSFGCIYRRYLGHCPKRESARSRPMGRSAQTAGATPSDGIRHDGYRPPGPPR